MMRIPSCLIVALLVGCQSSSQRTFKSPEAAVDSLVSALRAHDTKRLNQIFAEQTGQPIERIEQDTRRNFWLSAEEAIEYGLAGKVVRTIDEIE